MGKVTMNNNLNRIRQLCIVCLMMVGVGLLQPIQVLGSHSATFMQDNAQEHTITGVVTDSETGEELPGVNIAVEGTSAGTSTNAEGEYSITVPSANATLVFSFVGYQTQEMPINGRTNIEVSLEPETIVGEEMVVIGYGTVKKKDLTGSISHINAEELETEATSNVTDFLRGAVPGLNVGYTTNPKGLSSSDDLLVRGQTSLSATNAPLIVMDGMIYNGDLADINPSDVSSIDVLKGASASAIYGSRAANGVIEITTKKGNKGKPIINVSSSVGTARLSGQEIEPMNAEQFIDWRIAGFESNERHQVGRGPGYYNSSDNLPDGVSVDEWKGYDGSSSASDLNAIWLNRLGFSPLEIENYEAGQTLNWEDYQYQNGLTQDYNVSLSGGSDNVSYYGSLGYTNNEGVRYNQSYNAYRARLNIEGTVTNWLKVGTNTNFTIRNESPLPAGNNLLNNTPYSSFYQEDGETITYAPTGNISNSRHPWLELVYRSRYRKYNTALGKIYGTLSLPYGITFTSEFIPRFNWNRDYNHYSSGHPDWEKQGGRASRENTQVYEWQVNNILKWNKTYGDHSFDFTFVQNAEKYQYWNDYLERQQFEPSDVLGYHRIQAANETVAINSDDQVSTGFSLLGRLNYTYKSRYLLTASIRRDGYSAFGQKHPYANFPSVSLGWIISDEPFYNIEWLNQLKLRASYGINGNRGVDIYEALSNLSTGKFVLVEDGSPQYVSQLYTDRMGNQDLKWERTQAYNVGLDFSVLNNRISGTIEGYLMKTNDLLVSRQLPPITGFDNVTTNLGQVNNKGIELTLNSTNIEKKDFNWTSSFTLSHNKNEIVHLYGTTTTDENGNVREADDITNEWFIGHSINEIWDYKLDGIWQESEREEAAKYSREPGDFKQVDTNGDGVYTNDDKQFLGSTTPKFRWTLNNGFGYKNWDFNVQIYSYLGYYSSNNHKKNNDVFYDRGSSLNAPYWTPENPTNEWARIESYESGFEVWENNSFIRIDNVSLTYHVPPSLLNKFNVNRLSLTAEAKNPYVWSPYWSWMDPEVKGYTPSYFSFKLNLTL